MKKLLFGILICMVGMNMVSAANYEVKELIPSSVITSIHTSNFLYKDFYYDPETESIVFASIKNLTDNVRPIQFSIGLFDENKKNIGTIFFCEDSILADEIKAFDIKVSSYLGKEKEAEEIKYISLLGDNATCRKEGKDDYIGKKVEEIGYGKKSLLDTDSWLFVNIIVIVFIILIAGFLYRFLFTNRYDNMNGRDVRKDYEKYQEGKVKEKEELEEQEKQNPVIVQSRDVAPKKEMKEEDDIRNLYR